MRLLLTPAKRPIIHSAPVILLIVSTAVVSACARKHAAPSPAPVVVPPPSASLEQADAATAATTPSPACTPHPVSTTLAAAFAALPPVQSFPPPLALPPGQRGAATPVKDLGAVYVQVRLRPHNGMYTGYPGPTDALPDEACAVAELLSLDAADGAAFQRARDAHDEPAEVQALGRVTAVHPATDPAGARARLELLALHSQVTTDDSTPIAALAELLRAPLSWAPLGALMRIGSLAFDSEIDSASGYRVFAVAAAAAATESDAHTQASALAFAARAALETAQYDAAFAYAGRALADPGVTAILAEVDRASLVTTAEAALANLPDEAVDALATWTSPAAAEIARDTVSQSASDARLAKLNVIAARGNYPPRTPQPRSALSDTNSVMFLVNDCAVEAGISTSVFDVTVTVYAHGPADVTTSASGASMASCLRARAFKYFTGATTSVRARVTLQAI